MRVPIFIVDEARVARLGGAGRGGVSEGLFAGRAGYVADIRPWRVGGRRLSLFVGV